MYVISSELRMHKAHIKQHLMMCLSDSTYTVPASDPLLCCVRIGLGLTDRKFAECPRCSQDAVNINNNSNK